MDNYRTSMYNRRRQYPPLTPSCDAFNGYQVVSPENNSGIENMPLAMAYVPFQKWGNVMDATAAFSQGTIFQDLVLPFYGDKRRFERRCERF